MSDLLALTLSVSVPLRLAELARLPRDAVYAEMEARREEWVDLIASKGDVLLYGGKREGEAAKVFNALTNALAHLAHAPGGVRFLGLHFEAAVLP